MPHARVRNDDVFGPATSRGEGGSVPVLNSSIFLWTWAKARRPRKVAFSRLQRRCWWLPHIQTSSCAWSTFFAGCWGRHRKHCLLMAARLPLPGEGLGTLLLSSWGVWIPFPEQLHFLSPWPSPPLQLEFSLRSWPLEEFAASFMTDCASQPIQGHFREAPCLFYGWPPRLRTSLDHF